VPRTKANGKRASTPWYKYETVLANQHRTLQGQLVAKLFAGRVSNLLLHLTNLGVEVHASGQPLKKLVDQAKVILSLQVPLQTLLKKQSEHRKRSKIEVYGGGPTSSYFGSTIVL
jgi:hypothetical protein